MLIRYLGKEEFLWEGKLRRVILSEQGFNLRDDWPNGEVVQATVFCAAWWKASRMDGIDAFILHLGLWTTLDN